MAERDRLQPGEPVAAAGAAEENRQLLAHQPAAEAGENRRPNDQARALLLAAVGREPSDAPPLRVDGTADRVAAPASRIGQPPPPSGTSATKGRGGKSVGDIGQTRASVGFGENQEGRHRPVRWRLHDPNRLRVVFGAVWWYGVRRPGTYNGNSG